MYLGSATDSACSRRVNSPISERDDIHGFCYVRGECNTQAKSESDSVLCTSYDRWFRRLLLVWRRSRGMGEIHTGEPVKGFGWNSGN